MDAYTFSQTYPTCAPYENATPPQVTTGKQIRNSHASWFVHPDEHMSMIVQIVSDDWV